MFGEGGSISLLFQMDEVLLSLVKSFAKLPG